MQLFIYLLSEPKPAIPTLEKLAYHKLCVLEEQRKDVQSSAVSQCENARNVLRNMTFTNIRASARPLEWLGTGPGLTSFANVVLKSC